MVFGDINQRTRRRPFAIPRCAIDTHTKKTRDGAQVCVRCVCVCVPTTQNRGWRPPGTHTNTGERIPRERIAHEIASPRRCAVYESMCQRDDFVTLWPTGRLRVRVRARARVCGNTRDRGANTAK